MLILRKPLDTLTPSELSELWWNQVSEGTELELKSDLPCKAGPMSDPWYAGGAVGDYARNQIAEEIVAFANTLGGVVCIGVNETKDHPKRADSPNPVPRVHELARRLRQAVYDVIDPPLPVLEAAGVELEQDGSGVVILRTAASRRRPHRHNVNKEVYVRREDESVRISMREVQELTIQSFAEGTRLENLIAERRARYNGHQSGWLRERIDQWALWGGGIHLIGAPATPVELVHVTRRPQLTAIAPRVSVTFKGGASRFCPWPHVNALTWRPGLRMLSAETGATAPVGIASDRQVTYVVDTGGVCEMAYVFKATHQRPGLFAAWMMGALGLMLTWIERIRNEAGGTVEYALAAQIPVIEREVAFVQFGAAAFEESYGATLPVGIHIFPAMSIGPREEFPTHLARFDEDLWNLAGKEIASEGRTFSIEI